MAKKKPAQRKQKRKPAQAKRKSPRRERRRDLPTFNRENPNEWIDGITAKRLPFIRSLCKCLYHEPLLVRRPAHAVLCKWGMTINGPIPVTAPVGDNPDPDDVNVADVVGNMPGPHQLLAAGDAQFDDRVRQEDPEALGAGVRNGWPFAVAAFKYAGGNIPEAASDADAWRVRHLYVGAPAFDNGLGFDATRDPNHYTQSAGLVAVHPVVLHLLAQHSCIVNTLRARAFTEFNYDPANYFAPQAGHDACGFVI